MKNLFISLLFILIMDVVSWAGPTTFRIYYINDFHGFANSTQTLGAKIQLGGAARLALKLNELRAVQPGIFLAAGDMIQGDVWTNLSQGASTIELLNQLQLDAMVTGNHEYDYGLEALNHRISEAHFPFLASNVRGMPNDTIASMVYINRPGGRIAVIGLVTDDVPLTSHPLNTKGLSFLSPLETALDQIESTDSNTNLIVLLTHIGYEQDIKLAESICKSSVSNGTPILIVGGHSHTRVEQPVRIGNCVVVQAWEHGKLLGVVEMTIDKQKLLAVTGRLVEITTDLGNGDLAVANVVGKYNRKVDKYLSNKAGSASIDLNHDGARKQETNLGNLVADIARNITGAQVALINGGSLRSSIPRGDITTRQVYSALPFNNYLVSVRMNGHQLLQTLEHGISGVDKEEGRFPQVSGIFFSFDRRKPVGQRILATTVNGRPLDINREYTVATLDYIAAGGDGYTTFGQIIRSSGDYAEVGGVMRSSRLVYNVPSYLLRDMVLDMLAKSSPLATLIEGRIVEVR